MTPTGRFRVGRRFAPPIGAQQKRGTMLRFIPRDVWVAAALAVAVCLVELFDPAPTVFIVIYLGLCAHIVVQTVTGELD
jgi:hypothetical protein